MFDQADTRQRAIFLARRPCCISSMARLAGRTPVSWGPVRPLRYETRKPPLQAFQGEATLAGDAALDAYSPIFAAAIWLSLFGQSGRLHST